MRDPFVLPDNCEPVAFDLDIAPPPLPVCSLPPFTEPTVVTPELFFSLPFAPPPWNCYTIPTHQTRDFSPPQIGVPQLRVSVRIKPKEPHYDACDPELVMSINTSLPCLPLDASGIIEVAMVAGEPGCGANYSAPPAKGEIMLTMLPECTLFADISLEIPCIAFTPVFNVEVTEGAPGSPPQGSGQACVNGCELDLSLWLQIPRVSIPSIPPPSCPLGGDGGVSVYVTEDPDAPAGGTGSVTVTEDCSIAIRIDLNIPPPPESSGPSGPSCACAPITFVSSVGLVSNGIEVCTQTVNEDCSVTEPNCTTILGVECPPNMRPY